MKKRIRLQQVRIGMFVEDLEQPEHFPYGPHVAPFLISTVADAERVRNSAVMSLVINTRKGIDVDQSMHPPPVYTRGRFEAELLSRFSRQEVQHASQSIKETLPYIRQVLAEPRIGGKDRIDAAGAAVEQIMSASMNNAAALLTLARLKRRDEVTFLHSLAVSALMISFGRSLDLSEDTVRLLGIGGLVHDLGKVVIPLDILGKAGKLTPKEFAIVKLHPQTGFDMLREIDDLPPSILDICLHHHEKFDGSGYPFGLAGPDVPYSARIAVICDVYDALTTVRPYKQAWTHAQAIDLMTRSPGHFDPDLLAQFVPIVVGEKTN